MNAESGSQWVVGALLLAFMRHRMDPKDCRKDGIGWLRKRLDEDIPPNAIGPFAEARSEASRLLAMTCFNCTKKCPLAGKAKR